MAQQIKTEIMRKGSYRYDAAGRSLGQSLIETDQRVSQPIARQLVQHATSRLSRAGFDVDGWRVKVWTMDGDDAPADRAYGVSFFNSRGGAVEVVGILLDSATRRPYLDHGLAIREPESD